MKKEPASTVILGALSSILWFVLGFVCAERIAKRSKQETWCVVIPKGLHGESATLQIGPGLTDSAGSAAKRVRVVVLKP